MKFGIRKPSLKKSLKARTTGKMKRRAKSAINPFYGKKGMGYIRNPKKAFYNKVYNKTTVSVNPLSGTTRRKNRKVTSKPQKTAPSDNQLYTKYETIDKEVAVTNSIERFFRRLFGEKTIDTKIIQEKIIVEQHTYGEIKRITNLGQECISTYNSSINLAQSTEKPETFFKNLSQAEQALEEVVMLTNKYSFLEVHGDNLKESLKYFTKKKDSIIQEFADRYYSSCVDSAEKLKTDRGKKKRYLRNYQDLTPYFQTISKSSIEYFNTQWSEKVPDEELWKFIN